MIWQLLEIWVYAVMAVCTTAINWHRATWLSGAALILMTAVCTLNYYLLPFGAVVAFEAVLATLVASVSITLLTEGDAPKAHRVTIAICIIDMAFCGLISLLVVFDVYSVADAGDLFRHGADALFVMMCAAIAAPGAADAIRRWIRRIDVLRRDDSPTPDFNWLLSRLDDK